jgi:hypothetical protein
MNVRIWHLALAFILSLAFLCGLIAWLQNVHIITNNGMYKAIQGEPWIADPRGARLDPSNYLYFPLYGLLCRLLDAVGIARGIPWKQFAYLNAFFASLGVAFVYAFAHRLTKSAWAAAFAALFHLGSGFVLLLAVISEDIMPGYVLVLGAMLLAGLWFDRPTYTRVFLVGALFTLGWLMEWRLLFPTLPALVLALVLAEGTWKARASWVGALIASILAVSGIVQLLWDGHNGAVGLHDMLWTGKGVATGWAGIAWDKAWNLLSGVGNYLLLVGGFVDPASARRAALPLSLSAVLQFAILIATLALLWPRRHEPSIRAIAIVFLGTFAAGEVFNFYSQPQDPQMQVNVMPWLTVAWALIAGIAVLRPRMAVVVAILSCVPLLWNVSQLARWRGGDTAMQAALASLERQFPPERTVFVYWGFEPITVWQYALWSRTWDWDGAPKLDQRFKWIAITAGAIRHPQWTAEQHAEALHRDIDLALERGYRVIISDAWDWNAVQLAGQLGGMAAAHRAPAIHKMLHERYAARQVFTDPAIGTYYELSRR